MIALIKNPSPDVVTLILQFGASCDSHNAFGKTAFKVAFVSASHGDWTLMKLFLEWGCTVPISEEMQETMELNEFQMRGCEIINLNHRQDLNGQTCAVQRYLEKKD